MINPATSRETGRTKRARRGPVRMWEDTLVEVLGDHWRHTMAGCRSQAEWVGISRLAIEDLIHKWKLPKSALPSKDKVTMKIEERITTETKQFLMTDDFRDYKEGRVQFVVDCQTSLTLLVARRQLQAQCMSLSVTGSTIIYVIYLHRVFTSITKHLRLNGGPVNLISLQTNWQIIRWTMVQISNGCAFRWAPGDAKILSFSQMEASDAGVVLLPQHG